MSAIIRYLGLFFSAITVIALIVIITSGEDKDTRAEGKAFEDQNQEVQIDQYKMYSNFSGDQSQVIDLVKGKAEFEMTYSGSSKFTARLLQTDGTLIRVLTDNNGPYNNKVLIDEPNVTSCLLDVQTSGEWSLFKE